MPKKDFTQVAFDVVQRATGEKAAPVAKADPKAQATSAARRKSGAVGGSARAKKLTAAQRSEVAKLAASARWKKSN